MGMNSIRDNGGGDGGGNSSSNRVVCRRMGRYCMVSRI